MRKRKRRVKRRVISAFNLDEVVQVRGQVYRITNRLFGEDGTTMLCGRPIGRGKTPVWIFVKPGDPVRLMPMRGPTASEWMNFRRR